MGTVGDKQLSVTYKTLKYPVVAANVSVGKASPLYGLIKPYHVIVRNGKKIGFFGLASADLPIISLPSKYIVFKRDYEKIAANTVNILRNKEKVDIVIGLAAIGYSKAKSIAENVKGINIICVGNSASLVS